MDHAASPQLDGTVTRLVTDRGFGFIRANDGLEYFFHRSACEDYDDLRQGMPVTFRMGPGAKGPRAEDVRCR